MNISNDWAVGGEQGYRRNIEKVEIWMAATASEPQQKRAVDIDLCNIACSKSLSKQKNCMYDKI